MIDGRRYGKSGLRYQASGSQGRLQLAVDQDMATLKPAIEHDRMTFEYETLSLWTEGTRNVNHARFVVSKSDPEQRSTR